MQSALITVPGSRRPITVNSNGLVVNIPPAAQNTSPSSSSTVSSTSISRRKPHTTYRSPSTQFSTDLRVEHSTHAPPPSFTSAAAGLRRMPRTTDTHSNTKVHASAPRIKYPMKPPLPVYHPLGRLALSLPEIDLETLGLRSSLPITVDDAVRRSSSRARRPAAKLRDADIPAEVTVGSPLAGPADTPAEKPSPRKRRAGQSAGGKRKRREPEDGDGTYPAKRTRNARQAPTAASEVDSPAGSVPLAVEASEAGDGTEDTPKVVPERRLRSTRSRAAAAAKPAATRRGSSASDVTQTSVSISVVAGRPTPADKAEKMKVVEDAGILASAAVPNRDDGEKEKTEEPADEKILVDTVAAPEKTPTPQPSIEPATIAVSPPQMPLTQPAKASPEGSGKEEGELSEEGEFPSKR